MLTVVSLPEYVMEPHRKPTTLDVLDPRHDSPAKPVIQEAQRRLAGSSHLFLRSVSCSFARGVLTLRGRLPSFYLKQTAQSLLQNIRGVERIENRIQVVSCTGVSSEP